MARHDHDMTDHRLDAVILAGGRARRLGGVSKADLRVGGRRLLDVVMDAVDRVREGAEGCDVIVARESVGLPRRVLRTMEEPPGSGPLAGIDAGLQVLPPARPGDLVLVCAVDSPGIGKCIPQLCRGFRRNPATSSSTPAGGVSTSVFGGNHCCFRHGHQPLGAQRAGKVGFTRCAGGPRSLS